MKPYPEVENITPNTVAEMAAIYSTPFTQARIARAGITTSFLLDLMNLLGFKKQETAHLIDISSKTLDRHLKMEKPFKGLQSDRILELAELHLKGKKVFGSNQKFLNWLDSNLAALNNTSPREWLDTQPGIKAIFNEIGRIEHGIFA